MGGKFQMPPSGHHEFVLHVPTDRVGSVISLTTVGGETCKTVRFAGGEIISAPAREFRPATSQEIEVRHRLAASLRPLVLPAVSTARLSHGFGRSDR